MLPHGAFSKLTFEMRSSLHCPDVGAVSAAIRQSISL